MQLYVTLTSPYARLARIVVIEKGLQDRVEIVEAKTRTPDSPYYRINPSGRVPYLIAAGGLRMEDSGVICAYLDHLDGKPRLHPSCCDGSHMPTNVAAGQSSAFASLNRTSKKRYQLVSSRLRIAETTVRQGGRQFGNGTRADADWSHRRLEASARSMLDGIAVWAREMSRPESERSPTTLAHETARIGRMADLFEGAVAHPVLQGETNMAQLVLAVALETARAREFGDLTDGRPQLAAWLAPISQRSAMLATAPPKPR